MERDWRGKRLTGINVSDDNLGSLVGEEASAFCSDTLSGTGDDSDLASEHTSWVVQVASNLLGAVCHCVCME